MNDDTDSKLALNQPSSPQQEFESGPPFFKQIIALERERNRSQDQRTAVALQLVEAGDAADKRQYDFHVEKLRLDDEKQRERHQSVFRILWALFIVGSVVVASMFWMIFFGDDTQRTMASDILKTMGTGLGGAGIVWLFRDLYHRALN